MPDYIPYPYNRPPKKRPQSWFGPDDYNGGDWEAASKERELSIAAWDAERTHRLKNLSFLKRWWFTHIATDIMPEISSRKKLKIPNSN